MFDISRFNFMRGCKQFLWIAIYSVSIVDDIICLLNFDLRKNISTLATFQIIDRRQINVKCTWSRQSIYCFQQGDKNLENVTHEEAVATLKATQDRVVLLVSKSESGIVPPPPPPIATDNSLSPQPRKSSFLNFLRILLFNKIETPSSKKN